MKKRVLHIAEAPGGVERYLVTLMTKMRDYPEFEHILVCSDSYDTAKFEELAKEIIHVGSLQNAISPKKDISSVFAVRKIIKRVKPDIVYCHSSKAGAVGRLADIWIKNVMVYNGHGWAFNMKGAGGKKRKMYELVEKFLSPMTDRIVCISEYEKTSALEHKICKADKLTVINNGIDFGEFLRAQPVNRSEIGIPEDAFVVGMIGRLACQKAPDVFVKAAKKIKEKIPQAYFVIVGDGTDRREIEEQIKEAGLWDCFLITGWVTNPTAYAAVFDTAVLLSRWEGFGLVLPEYMMALKPIVATKADAIPYVVGEAGLLVDIEDWQAAADAVVSIYNDEQLRNKLISAGKERVGLFDAQRTADEHAALFKSLT